MKKDIRNSIFTKNFDLSKVDPSFFDISFIITAVVHNYKYMDILDAYFKKDDIPYLILALAHQDKYFTFIENVKIGKNLELGLRHIFTLSKEYKKNVELPIKSFNYLFVRDNGSVGSLEGHTDTYTLELRSLVHKLSNNTSTPYPLLKMAENWLLSNYDEDYAKLQKTFQSLSYQLIKSQTPDQAAKQLADEPLSLIKKHPNYSTSQFILENLE